MPTFTTRDGVVLRYIDWGAGRPTVFVSSWALGGQMWEYQMQYLAEAGMRCIAYDRRGAGRSDDPGRGYDLDTLADDLAALLDQLDLRDAVLVGHSFGGSEITRCITRHGAERIARIALDSPVTPCLLHGDDNPQGFPASALEASAARLKHDRPRFYREGVPAFFSLDAAERQPTPASGEQVEWLLGLIMQCSLHAALATQHAQWHADLRPDLRALDLPALVIHGDDDRSAPLALFGTRTADLIQSSVLRVYQGGPHGLFVTHREQLNRDLLSFAAD
jgi:pimeloyl-ACP methyl ester carboxylesterase